MAEKRFKFIRDSVARNLKTPLCDNDGQSLTLGEVLDKMNELSKENEQLKSEIEGMKELLKSYRKTIKHDAELLADATKNGYLPPLEEWKEVRE